LIECYPEGKRRITDEALPYRQHFGEKGELKQFKQKPLDLSGLQRR